MAAPHTTGQAFDITYRYMASDERPSEAAIAIAKGAILADQEEAEPDGRVKRNPKPRKRTARRR